MSHLVILFSTSSDHVYPRSAQNYASPSKTSGSGALEEDEGFSDWTQRLGQERKLRLENGRPAEPEAAERGVNGAAKHTEKMHCASSATTTTTARLQRSQQDREENHEEVGEEEDVRLGSRMSEKKRKEFGRKEHHQTHREVQQKSKDVVNPIKKRGESEIADVDEKVGPRLLFVLNSYDIMCVKLVTVIERGEVELRRVFFPF